MGENQKTQNFYFYLYICFCLLLQSTTVLKVRIVQCTIVNIHTYIFWWHNFFEFVECELRLALADVLPEDLLQPADVLLIQYTADPEQG